MVSAGVGEDGGRPGLPRTVPGRAGGITGITGDGTCSAARMGFAHHYPGFREASPSPGPVIDGRTAFTPADGLEPSQAAARSVPLRDLLNLARWIAPGRPLTGAGTLGPGDVRAAVAELGLWPAVTKAHAADRADRLRRLRDARELPEFIALWRAAVRLGIIEVDSRVAYPAAGFSGGGPGGCGDGRLLSVWRALFRAALVGDGIPGRDVGGGVVLPAALEVVWKVPEGTAVPLMELVDTARVLRRGRHPTEPERYSRMVAAETVYAGVVRLARVGAVRSLGASPATLLVPHRLGRGRSPLPLWPGAQEATSTAPIDGAVVLTPLGRHGTLPPRPRDGVHGRPVPPGAVPALPPESGAGGPGTAVRPSSWMSGTGTAGLLGAR